MDIRSPWAATADGSMYQLNSFKPNIIHFVGHGADGRRDRPRRRVRSKSAGSLPQALGVVFANFRQWLQVVVLNACYSAAQVQSLAEQADELIGMRDAIGDDAAIEFSASRYRAIGFGRTVQDAFDQAVAALLIVGLPRRPGFRYHLPGWGRPREAHPRWERPTSLSLSAAPRIHECRKRSGHCSATEPNLS